MDYKRLAREADMVGRDALERKAGWLGVAARDESSRNETGRPSRGLRSARRAVKFQLAHVSSEFGCGPENNVGAKPTKKVVSSKPVKSIAVETGKQVLAKIELAQPRTKTFSSGVEMMHAEVRSTLKFVDEVGETRDAFKIYEGKKVRRYERKRAVTDHMHSYYVEAVDERFMGNEPDGELYDGFSAANGACNNALEDASFNRVTNDLEEVERVKVLEYQNSAGQMITAFEIYAGVDKFTGEYMYAVRGMGVFASGNIHGMTGYGLVSLKLACEKAIGRTGNRVA